MASEDPAVFLQQLVAGFVSNSFEDLARKIYEQAITSDLKAIRPAAAERAASAQAAADDGWEKYQTCAARLAKVEGDLAAAEQAADDDRDSDEDCDLGALRERHLRRLANAKAIEELEQRCNIIRPILQTLIQGNGKLRTAADSATDALAMIDAAIQDPFGHHLAKSTTGYRMYLLFSGRWQYHLSLAEKETPTGLAARRIVMDALRASGGFLEEIQQEAVNRSKQVQELHERVRKVNQAPGDPNWQGSVEREGDRTPLGPVSPGIPGMGGST